MVLGAASGNRSDRETFSCMYEPVIRSYLAARWSLPVDHEEVTEAVQDVFVQCFKQQGALESVDRKRGDAFRPYLFGVTRNVALMIERSRRRRERALEREWEPDEVAKREATLSQVFDRSWMLMITRRAREVLARRARHDESRALRFRCLSLRYLRGMPPREIASTLRLDVSQVYERLREAREEFREAVLEVMRELHPHATRNELERACQELVEVL